MAMLRPRGDSGLVALLKPLYISPRCRGRYISSPSSRQYKEANDGPRRRLKDVAIVGGGITGLTSAYYLTKLFPNARITIYEASDRLGGWINSRRINIDDHDVIFESGPRTLRSNLPNGPVTYALIDDLGLSEKILLSSGPESHAAKTVSGGQGGSVKRVPQSRYIYYPDHLVRLPGPGMGLIDSVKALLGEPLLKDLPWSIAREFSVPPAPVDDESVGSFFSRRFGPDVVNNLLSAAVHGIYAGDVWKLSVKSLVPRVQGWERMGGVTKGIIKEWRRKKETESRVAHPYIISKAADAIMIQALGRERASVGRKFGDEFKSPFVYTLEGGLETLTKTLETYLKGNQNVRIKTNTAVSKITPNNTPGQAHINVSTTLNLPAAPYDHVIATIPGPAVHTLTTPSLPSLALTPAVTVMVVNLLFPSPPEQLLPVRGFGYLIPRSVPLEQNPERALGVIFDSDATAGLDNAPGTKLTVMLGGHWWDWWTHYPTEEEGLTFALNVLERHLDIKEPPSTWSATLQRNCIPQYTVGHHNRMIQARNELRGHKWGRLLSVVGSGYGGVGVNDCVREARDLVHGLRENPIMTGLERFHEGDDKYTLMSKEWMHWV